MAKTNDKGREKAEGKKIRLTRSEKKQLQALMARNQRQTRNGPRTAPATIPYQRMWPDGICRVTDSY